jgi:hypothetical protein
MNRLRILLTLIVMMVGALFVGHQALAKVLTGSAAEDTHWGPTGPTASTGAAGRTASRVATGLTASRAAAGRISSRATAATTASGVAEATTRSSPAKATTRCTLATATTSSTRDTDGVDYIDCGPGFDKVETIHRDDETLSNCERTLGPRRGHI